LAAHQNPLRIRRVTNARARIGSLAEATNQRRAVLGAAASHDGFSVSFLLFSIAEMSSTYLLFTAATWSMVGLAGN